MSRDFTGDKLLIVATYSTRTKLRSGATRAATTCCAAALAVLSLPLASASAASMEPGAAGKTTYIQPGSLDVDASLKSYNGAAQMMDGAAVVYKPTYTAGLKRDPGATVTVVSNDLVVTDGTVASGETYVGATYGSKSRKLTVHEKIGGTTWGTGEQDLFFCAGIEMCNRDWWRDFPRLWPEWGTVGTVQLDVGEPGEQTTVTARVFAKCREKSSESRPSDTTSPQCDESDVSDGGLLSFTMKDLEGDSGKRAVRDKSAATTDIVLETEGLDWNALIRIAQGMVPVLPAPWIPSPMDPWTHVPVTMLSTCAQAIAAGTLDNARAVASSNGFTVRVSMIDFQPQVGSTDVRQDRINVDIVNDRIVNCTYG